MKNPKRPAVYTPRTWMPVYTSMAKVKSFTADDNPPFIQTIPAKAGIQRSKNSALMSAHLGLSVATYIR